MKQFLIQMLSAASGRVSSKRVMGCLGWLIILTTYVYYTVTTKQIPEFTDSLIMAIVALLGVDSVANVFKHEER